MTTPAFGVTPQGFNAMRLPEIKDELEDLFIAEFGDINLESQSVTGQLIGIFSKVLADDWENLSDVYLSQYPNSASGISLDNVVQLNGLTRLPALRTSVIGSATGVPGTLIPSGSLARLTASQQIFVSTENVIISNSNALQSTVTVTEASAQQYTILINGVSYIYSLPTLDFSGPIVVGNTITLRINGVNAPAIPYNTSSAQTLTDLANALVLNFDEVLTATVVGNSVQVVPTIGFEVIISSENVAGGGAPAASVSFRNVNTDTVAEYLSANIDNSTIVSSSYTAGSVFTVSARNSSLAYVILVGNNVEITSTASPVPFIAQTYGPIPVPANSLTEILTPVAGWVSLTNPQAGITGRFQETDAELRIRRAQSLHSQGAATVEAITSRLLQEVPGVTSVNVFENVTLTQGDITVLFSVDFIAGNTAQVTIDGNNIGSVVYATTHLAMMNALAALIASQPEIMQVLVAGVSNRELLISMQDGEEVEISFNITGGASQPTYSESGGRSPKSFEAVVEGGSDQDVALKIWQLKPAGIQTFGNVNNGAGIIIIDSWGNQQVIHFTRAIPVYMWATLALVTNPQETFPGNGQELVSQAVLAYGNSLGIGVDVIIQRVQAAAFSVPGLSSVTVQLARTLATSTIPSFVSTNIDIGETEISVWDLSRINVSI